MSNTLNFNKHKLNIIIKAKIKNIEGRKCIYTNKNKIAYVKQRNNTMETK